MEVKQYLKNALIIGLGLTMTACAGRPSIKKELTLEHILEPYNHIAVENHYFIQPDLVELNQLYNQLDNYNTLFPDSKAKNIIKRVQSRILSMSYNFKGLTIKTEFGSAIKLLDQILTEELDKTSRKSVLEDLLVLKASKDLIDSSKETGFPSSQSYREFEEQKKKEKTKWTHDGVYNAYGFADEMSAIKGHLYLRSAEQLLLKHGTIREILNSLSVSYLVTKQNKDSYLHPRALLDIGISIGRLRESLEYDSSKLKDNLKNKLGPQAKLIGYNPNDSYGTFVGNLFKSNENLELLSDFNLKEALFKIEAKCYREITTFFGASPEAEIAKGKFESLMGEMKRSYGGSL